MSVTVNVNGTSYTIPQSGATAWGSSVTSWIQGISLTSVPISGGTLTLTGDVSFDASFGLKAVYYKSVSATISTAGTLRLASTESVGWRNSGNSANLLLLPKSADNTILTYGGLDLVDVSTAQTLTNKTLTAPVIDVETLTDQGSTPSTPSSGSHKFYVKTDGNAYLLDSSGTEREIGSGGTGLNYIDNGTFEVNVTGWTTYADAAATSPVNGTGGSPTVTFARTTSSPLRGAGSGLFTKDAANRQGEGVSYDFSIDSADKGRMCQITCDYSVASGTFATGDMRVYVYDVTNSRLIEPVPVEIVATSVNSQILAEFQTSIDSTSYRLIFHVASTSSSAYTVKLDNVSVSPTAYAYGMPGTDWTSFTPTGAWSSNVTYVGAWKRVGDSMHVNAVVAASGATTSATFTLNLPSGYSIDTAKIPGFTQNNTILNATGGELFDTSASDRYPLEVVYSTTTAVSVIYPPSGLLSNTNPVTIASGDKVSITFSVPIAGWSSSTVVSTAVDNRVCAARYTTATAGSYSDGTIIDFDTKVFDTHSAVTTGASWKFTAPFSGYYKIKGAIRLDAYSAAGVGTDQALVLKKNGSSYSFLSQNVSETTTSVLKYLGGEDLILLNAGDTVNLTPSGLGGARTLVTDATINYISIERVSGPSQVFAADKIAARYTGSASTFSGGTVDVSWTTKDYDTHAALSGTTFTSPRAGYFKVNASCSITGTFSAGQGLQMEIKVNGTTVSQRSITHSGSASSVSVNLADILKLSQGSTVKVTLTSAGTSPVISSTATENFISILGE